MTHLLILIPLSLGMGLIGLGAFVWALRNDQFDDPEGNSCRVLIQSNPPDAKEISRDNIASHPEYRDTQRGL